jgi:hypothetical protein
MESDRPPRRRHGAQWSVAVKFVKVRGAVRITEAEIERFITKNTVK